jgi:hypothetical protein
VVFAGDFEDSREGSSVSVDAMPYPVGDLVSSHLAHCRSLEDKDQGTGAAQLTYVLVDQDDSDVLSLRGEPLKCRFYGRSVRLAVHD